MDSLRRENRILRGVVVLLFCVAAVQLVKTHERKPGSTTEQSGAVQRVPGPGSGVVDVSVVNDVQVGQRGEWRVAQHGDWRVGVQGTVTTTTPELPFLKVGATYTFQWAEHWNEVKVVREIHPGGWVRVDSSDRSRTRWINLSQAASIERH